MPADRRLVLLGGVLVLSLAGNLFLGGAFAGRFAVTATPAVATQGRGAMLARFMALPPADRERFREAMRQNGADIPAARRALRQAQARVVATIRATPYDKLAMQQAFAGLRVALDAQQQALQSALAEAFAALTPEERAQLAGPGRVTSP